MDESRYRIREYDEADLPAQAALTGLVNPDRPRSVEEGRRWKRILGAPPGFLLEWTAEERATGLPVGFGGLSTSPWSYHPHKFWLDIEVHPDHRGRGVALALTEVARAEAHRRKAVTLWSGAQADDERSVRFLTRQGFVERRRVWQSRLDLAGTATLPDRSAQLNLAGISFTTLAVVGVDRDEVLHGLHALSGAIGRDIPRIGTEHTSASYEQFLELEVTGDHVLPDGFFLARHGSTFVGLSNLTRIATDPKGLDQQLTGVLREYRGRGIAQELKRRTVDYGRRKGYRYIQTWNDSLNAPMWAVNEKLGFQRRMVSIQAEQQLGTD